MEIRLREAEERRRGTSDSQRFRDQSPVLIRPAVSYPCGRSLSDTYRVPSEFSRETLSPAARVASRGNVVEDGCGGRRVQQRVQEAERGLAGIQPVVVDEGNDTREGWAGRARSVDGEELPVRDDGEGGALSGDIGVSTS